MIDLGDPLHSADTCYLRASPDDVFAAVLRPREYGDWWPSLRTAQVRAGPDGPVGIGDSWHTRALLGAVGLDCVVVVTDLRDDRQWNVWMDLRGVLDPVAGLGVPYRPFEAETEWYLRAWRSGTLLSAFWRVRAEPRRRQERLLLRLRRLSWRGMHGLKERFEAGTVVAAPTGVGAP